MLLFRSEEHARRWTKRTEGGETVTLAQAWEMARAWFGDRMERSWERTPARARRMLDDLGLSGPFWNLPAG